MSLTEFFQTNPGFFVAFVVILGLIIGSFINVVIYRLPIMLEKQWREQCRELLGYGEKDVTESSEPFNLIVPRSRCPHCGQLIKAFSNIPVISFLVQKGKCSECNLPISIRYPVVEILSALMAAVVAIHYGLSYETLFAIVLTWSLIILSFIDLDHQILPDDIIYPVLWLGLIVNMFGLFTDIYSSLIGSILGYTILWTVFIVFKLLTGKEGMGYGDFKLLALLGAWLGWQAIPLIILVSSLMGALIGISLILFAKRDKGIPIPFGPYLALAGWIALLWGNELNVMYISAVTR